MTLTKGGKFEEDLGTAEDWTELVDRRGLWHICENIFHLFCIIEQVVQMQLSLCLSRLVLREKVMTTITTDNNVQFYWLIILADFEIEDSNIHTTESQDCI